MTEFNPTATDLRAIMHTAQTIYSERLGYSNASVEHIAVQQSGFTLSAYLMDDFQKDLQFTERYEAGYIHTHFKTPQELWDTLATKPNREQRELKHLLKLTAQIGGQLDKIETAQARAFAQQIISAGEVYANLIAAQ